MSHHPDESTPDPDDHLFVDPYTATHSPAPSQTLSTTPVWPGSPVPEPEDLYWADPAPAAAPAPHGAAGAAWDGARDHDPGRDHDPDGGHDRGRDRAGSRLPWAVLGLLALGAAGGLMFLPAGSDPEPDRPVKRPDLSIPQLPAGGPDTAEPSPGASGRSSAPSASPSPSGSTSAKPTPSPSASATQQTGATGTLRMGDRGPEVSALQQRLYGQGFTYVSVTGVYDGQTKRGVAQLQRDRDIKGDPTGVYGPATRAAFAI